MNEENQPRYEAKVRLKLLRCRRTGLQIAVDEHHRCPYCYGTENDIVRGHYETFCDFQPGKDPFNFGFPRETQRDRSG